ncbi:MAG: hypothetical protein J6K74_01670 [Marinifilaceae bacterium]|nr:hypothetical protein [Marinifilaceae bacterium]
MIFFVSLHHDMHMEQEEQIKRIEAFIDTIIKGELKQIIESNALYMKFVLIGQTIEVLGALLDNKPMKAKGQSARRFNHAINSLFGGDYRVQNSDYYLYDKLRNQMTHSFIPGGDIELYSHASDTDKKHMKRDNGVLVMVADEFFRDIVAASNRLLYLIRVGKIKAKNIAFDYE